MRVCWPSCCRMISKNPLGDELQRLRGIFGDRAYCALTRRFLPDEAARLRDIANAAAQARRRDRRHQ